MLSEKMKITLKEMLENKSVGYYENVQNVLVNGSQRYSTKEKIWIAYPDLELYCTNCKGKRSFVREMYPYTLSDPEIEYDYPYAFMIDYLCSNCKTEIKYFAIRIWQIEKSENADVYKLGEYPPNVDSLPTKLITIFGKCKDLVIKAKYCENHGLGLGAITYYRRIVENQKNKLIDSLYKAMIQINPDPDLLVKFEKAKLETQFSTSIELIKDFIPEELYIGGHNPLKLLYKSMSIGIHNLSDEKCLEIGKDIRIVLCELVKKINEVLKGRNELAKAVKSLNDLNNIS